MSQTAANRTIRTSNQELYKNAKKLYPREGTRVFAVRQVCRDGSPAGYLLRPAMDQLGTVTRRYCSICLRASSTSSA